MNPERFVIGASDDTEAEYGFRSDRPFTVLTMLEGEVFVTEGFATLAAARADLKANGVAPEQVELL